MSHKQDYITKQSEICRKEWFKDHKAAIITGVDTTNAATVKPSLCGYVINWQNPKSWIYGCRFIIHRRWLCVVGDIGEATFEWSEDLTLEFLAQIDFGYFLSKCRASPTGKDFEQWDEYVAWAQREEIVNGPPLDTNLVDYLCELEKSSGKDDYEQQARDCYNETGEAELAGMIANMGKVPSVHAIGMFVGLQMAIAQLKGSV